MKSEDLFSSNVAGRNGSGVTVGNVTVRRVTVRRMTVIRAVSMLTRYDDERKRKRFTTFVF